MEAKKRDIRGIGSASGLQLVLDTNYSAPERDPRNNVLNLLLAREICPSVGRSKMNAWRVSDPSIRKSRPQGWDAKSLIPYWCEKRCLHHCSGDYCTLVPAPRSTIAADFSPDGSTLASTHGDHTVKIINCETGRCVRVLSGHRRTPWVVRFHPFLPNIVASGSLDHEVKIWDSNTAECLQSCDFGRPIASVTFHAVGDLMAVASGHKLHIWHYGKYGDKPSVILRTRRSLRAVQFHPHGGPYLLTAEVNGMGVQDCPPTISLVTGQPFYPSPTFHFVSTTAQANALNIDQDLRSIPARSRPPFSHWRWPRQFRAAMGPRPFDDVARRLRERPRDSFVSGDGVYLAANFVPRPVPGYWRECSSPPAGEAPDMDGSCARVRGNVRFLPMFERDRVTAWLQANPWQVEFKSLWPQEWPGLKQLPSRLSPSVCSLPWPSTSQAMTRLHERAGKQEDCPPSTAAGQGESTGCGPDSLLHGSTSAAGQVDTSEQSHPPLAVIHGVQFMELQQCRQGAGMWSGSHGSGPPDTAMSPPPEEDSEPSVEVWMRSSNSDFPTSMDIPEGDLPRPRPHDRLAAVLQRHAVAPPQQDPPFSSSAAMEEAAGGLERGQAGEQVSEEEYSARAAEQLSRERSVVALYETLQAQEQSPSTELPCTVMLRVWAHNIDKPKLSLQSDACRMIIPHAILCSEMGAQFSPCGKYLAACVACVAPPSSFQASQLWKDTQQQQQQNQSPLESSTADSDNTPTSLPPPITRIVYELRVYSMEGATFGKVLAARSIRAAHCLTSIQFSPNSSHILLAYGRRHSSLLRTFVADGSNTVPFYTIVEVYRMSDMALVSLLPSAVDEINVACFHPQVGGGLLYGTKEGKLRILKSGQWS